MNMVAITTLGCSVFTRFFRYWRAISWLLAGYVPKSIHLHIVIYYYLPKCHMAAINTLDGSVITRFFRLSAAYQLAMFQNQYISGHSHILLRTKVAHALQGILWTLVHSHDIGQTHRLTD